MTIATECLTDNFILGTQYYRAPTPLPEEWDEDISAITALGLNAIQLRIQWRWNERREGEYDFRDIDQLFESAARHGQRVILKFMLETAPDYIFNHCDGARRDMNGMPLRGGGHGAFYVGGWWPCFDNPAVLERAQLFVQAVTARYRDRPELLLWNIWNEPRMRPIGDCGCPHSIHSYQEYLRREYGTVEHFNSRFGKCFEDFSTISPPAMPYDFAELFVWRQWAAYALAQRLKAIYQCVREIDSTHPIISHVGVSRIQQDAAADVSDDLQNAAQVDFYGTSFGVMNHCVGALEEAMPFLLCDWQRAIGAYFWVYELYPDWGNWHVPATIYDFKYRLWAAIAAGAKGILFWQYRAERVGCESDNSGLVHINGRPKALTAAAAEAAAIVTRHRNFLFHARVKEDGVMVLYDSASDLINRIEHTGLPGELHNFDLDTPFPYPYKKAIWGIYTLFREIGVQCHFADSRKLTNALEGIHTVYVPEGFMIRQECFELLRHFVRQGGRLIAEEGFMLRDEATWVRSSWPAAEAQQLFGAVIVERVAAERRNRKLFFPDGRTTIAAGAFASRLEPLPGAEVIAHWDDGSAGAVRQGQCTFLGTSLGAGFYEHPDETAAYGELLQRLLPSDLRMRKLPRGVGRRTLAHKDEEMDFYFNSTGETLTVNGITLTPEEVTVVPPRKIS